jgi:hypothetical protein
LIVPIEFSMSFVDWIFLMLLIVVVEIGLMVDCRVADLGPEFGRSGWGGAGFGHLAVEGPDSAGQSGFGRFG